MDKNTLYGMLMMGLVIFGFMYLNKSDQEKLQQEMQQQTEQQQAKEAAEAARSLIVDSISPAEVAGIPAILRKAGTPGAEGSATVRYTTPTVDLTYDGENVGGTVNAGDTTLTYAAVVHSQFGDDLSIDKRKTAVANLRKALTDAERYRGFARHLSGKEQLVTLENDVLRLDINTHGGNVAQATLLDYDTYLPKPGNKNEIDTAAVNVCRLQLHPDFCNTAFRHVELLLHTRGLERLNGDDETRPWRRCHLGAPLHTAQRLICCEDGSGAAEHG